MNNLINILIVSISIHLVHAKLIPSEIFDLDRFYNIDLKVDSEIFNKTVPEIKLKSEKYDVNDHSAPNGEYYKLTDSHLFDVAEDVLERSLRIGSTGGESSVDEDLVIVPCGYEDTEDEIVEEEEEDEENQEGFGNNLDRDEHEQEFNEEENWKLWLYESSNSSSNYFESMIQNQDHLFETMKLGQFQGKRLQPLFLTPYVYSKNYLIGQKLSVVKPFVGDVKSHAGYFTVDKRYHSNLFFWYFPCERPDHAKRPVLLWLQGGPGSSSMFGLFYENGPYKFVHGKIHRNRWSWTQEYNVVYIDNPVGTGFSFTSPGGHTRNQTIIGKHLYEGLKQFFHLFPNLQANDFYITGESYAGKYIPGAAYEIHQRNLMSHFKINLKGLFIGNGLIDPISMLEYNQYLYYIGLLDERQRDLFAKEEKKIELFIRTKQWRKASTTFADLFFSSRENKTTGPSFRQMTGFTQHYNLNGLDFNTKDFKLFVQDASVRERLHVGYLRFNNGDEVGNALYNDLMKSQLPIVNILVENYRTVFYYGQLDIICPYRLSMQFFHNIEFRNAYDYYKADRQVWTFERQDDSDEDNVMGLIKEAGNLVEVLIRRAGHMVPRDQPRYMMDLLRKYIRS